MLLGYELDELLQHKENRNKVIDILTFLETDLISEELLQYRAELINKLHEMGEDKIYNKIKEREKKIISLIMRN